MEWAKGEFKQAPWAWKFQRRTVTTRIWHTWIIHLAVDDRPSGPWIHIDTRNSKIRRVEYTPPADRWRRIAAGSLLAVAVILIFAAFFPGRVCDDQVVSSGKVVSVCRHLQATDPPVIALGIVVIAALGVFYSEISGFGISLKRRVDEVDQAAREGLQLAEQNQKVTKRLNETADDLTTYNREVRSQAAETPSLAGSEEAESSLDRQVRDLAARYNTLRGTMPSSDERTRLMADIVRDLRNLLREVPDFDVAKYLSSTDRGLRLAAYAYLLEHEAPQYRSQLVGVVYDEDKPFGQYTGLEALQYQGRTAERLPEEDLRKLSFLAQKLGPGEDRTRLINDIIALERSKG